MAATFKNLMFNRYSQSFHLSHNPFACIRSPKRVKRMGNIIKLAPVVYAIVTRDKAHEAQTYGSASVPVFVTKYPRIRLFWERFKEIINE